MSGVPVATRPLVVRTRLLGPLQDRWRRRVTAVVAGAGFGKTSLLSQAVYENALAPSGEDVWVSCTPGDDVPSVLAQRLHAALGTAAPEGDDVEVLAQSVAESLAARAPVPVCLLLDDLHRLPPDSGGAALLGELLPRLPTDAHLVVASRTSPPLPLARLYALGDAVLLREDDLAFDDDELARFAGLREQPLHALREAGRWPAVVELTVSAAAPVVGEFLWQEVLDQLPDQRRRLLGVLALLGGADDAELSAAAGQDVAVADLVADLPLATVADGRAELHALWTPSLLALVGEEDQRRALRAVAALRRGAADYAAAFDLLRRAEAWEELFDLVVDSCGPAYPLASVDVLEQWQEVLIERWPGRPETDLLAAAAAILRSDDTAGALPPARRAWAAYREAGDVKGEVAAMVAAFQGSYFVGDVDVMAAILTRLLELEAGGHEEIAAIAPLGHGVYARFIGDYAAARDQFRSIPRDALSREWNAMRDSALAEAFASLGEPEKGMAHLRRWPYDDGGVLGELRQEALINIGFVAGEVDEAWERVRRALSRPGLAAGRWRQGFEAAASRIGSYLGLVDEARPYLDAALAHGIPTDEYMADRVAIAEAVFAVSDGDEARACAALGRTTWAPSYGLDRSMALPYVLGPHCRAAFDEAPLGPAYARTRDLARAVADMREGRGPGRVADLAPLDPVVVRPALPLPWATLLAVGGEAVSRVDARPLLTALGPGSRAWLGIYADHADTKVRAAARRLLAEIPATPSRHVTVRLLGPGTLAFDGEPADAAGWRRERVRELMAWLVLHPSTTREATADALWPDLGADAGANNLRSQLSALLQVLQPERRSKEASAFVTAGDRTLVLEGGDHLTVDVWELERHLEEAQAAERAGTPSLALTSYKAAADQWHGPLLAGAPTAWADDDAERLRVAFVHAAARGAELSAAAGGLADAMGLARRALEADPWSERAFRALATAQLAAGDEEGATQTLARCRAALDELGVDPEPATAMLGTRLSTLARTVG